MLVEKGFVRESRSVLGSSTTYGVMRKEDGFCGCFCLEKWRWARTKNVSEMVACRALLTNLEPPEALFG
jgi:hypothetical protein